MQRTFSVNLPAFPEQQKIASFLSAVDQKIQQLTRKKKLLEQYKKGVMQKIFSQEIRFKPDIAGFDFAQPAGGSQEADQTGVVERSRNYPDWEEKRLGEVAIKKSSNVAANTLEERDGYYPIYGASGYIKGVDFYNEENEYIAIVKDGAGVGRNFLCPKKSSVLGTMDIILTKPGHSIHFLYYILQQIGFFKYIIGSTIPHIYFKDYSKERIIVPCIDEQKKIAEFLSNIDNKIESIQTQINHTQKFKKGLLQQMFV
jgi:type I restriction enzyme S subunit